MWIDYSGSSPLTRGKRIGPRPSGSPTGLIPAHAGKTVGASLRYRCPRAHPRSRGENGMLSRQASVIQGSSPLTRGKRVRCIRRMVLVRLIPAHAGKTPSMLRCARVHAAHPRSRGENFGSDRGNKTHVGSSPLTRGKLLTLILLTERKGLIPAHAGKTLKLSLYPF